MACAKTPFTLTAIRRLAKRSKRNKRIYQCPDCKGWHFTDTKKIHKNDAKGRGVIKYNKRPDGANAPLD